MNPITVLTALALKKSSRFSVPRLFPSQNRMTSSALLANSTSRSLGPVSPFGRLSTYASTAPILFASINFLIAGEKS